MVCQTIPGGCMSLMISLWATKPFSDSIMLLLLSCDRSSQDSMTNMAVSRPFTRAWFVLFSAHECWMASSSTISRPVRPVPLHRCAYSRHQAVHTIGSTAMFWGVQIGEFIVNRWRFSREFQFMRALRTKLTGNWRYRSAIWTMKL